MKFSLPNTMPTTSNTMVKNTAGTNGIMSAENATQTFYINYIVHVINFKYTKLN